MQYRGIFFYLYRSRIYTYIYIFYLSIFFSPHGSANERGGGGARIPSLVLLNEPYILWTSKSNLAAAVAANVGLSHSLFAHIHYILYIRVFTTRIIIRGILKYSTSAVADATSSKAHRQNVCIYINIVYSCIYLYRVSRKSLSIYNINLKFFNIQNILEEI